MDASSLDHRCPPILELDGLEHRLVDKVNGDSFTVYVNQPIAIRSGSFTAIRGKSGCGKTTLLSVLGLLRAPSHPDKVARFRIHSIDDQGSTQQHDVAELWRKRRMQAIELLRRRCIGFALQTGDLVSSLTVRENIALPMQLNGATRGACDVRVNELLTAFALDQPDMRDSEAHAAAVSAPRSYRESIAVRRVNRLSGGEYQRVALARAIAHRPSVAFVDEPTSALNREYARAALRELKASMSSSSRCGAVVMITHDEELATEFADLIITMKPMAGGKAGEVDDISTNTPTE